MIFVVCSRTKIFQLGLDNKVITGHLQNIESIKYETTAQIGIEIDYLETGENCAFTTTLSKRRKFELKLNDKLIKGHLKRARGRKGNEKLEIWIDAPPEVKIKFGKQKS